MLGKSLHIAGGHASAASGAQDAVDVNAKLFGDPANCRGGQCSHLLGGDHFRFVSAAGQSRWCVAIVVDAAHDGASVFALFAGGTLGCFGFIGGGAGGGLAALSVAHQHGAHIDDVTFRTTQFGDHTRPRAGDFHQRFVRFHLRKGLVFGNLIAHRDPPLDEFGFVHTLSEIGKDEMGFVGGLFDLGHKEAFRPYRSVAKCFVDGRADPIGTRQVFHLKFVVGHDGVETSNPLHRSFQVKEASFGDQRRNF